MELVEIATHGPGPARPARARPARARPARHLADLSAAGRRAAVADLGQPGYRADQLSRHYFGRLTDSAQDMTDLPAGVRGELVAALLPSLLTATRQLTCDRGLTRKTLWRAADGAFVESVLMRYGGSGGPSPRASTAGRVTMCVSSQAGCGMACPFCATGQAGLTRNLSTAEIVTQVFSGARGLARGELAGGPGRISNVVFMGMGEPLANYASVLRAVRRLSDPVPDGLGISQRAITVSTVGVVPAIRRLAGEGLSCRLAVSLHAPDDELARLLAGRLTHVNLIPLNPTPGSKWTASGPGVAAEFEARLADRGIPVTVRDTRGREIDGACGQLAAAGGDSTG